MPICPDINDYLEFIRDFDQTVEIEKKKDKPLRFNVWKTISDDLTKIFDKGNIDHLPQDGKDTSRQVISKINRALDRIQKSNFQAESFKSEILSSANNIEMSIALHELMESVKGEADKARNNGLEPSSVSNDGILPAVPLSRLAASIGRKIAYQKGHRFKAREETTDNAEKIEALYYALGIKAIEDLEAKGYVNSHDGVPTIRDYISKEDLNKPFPKTGMATSDADKNHVKSVSLDSEKLGIYPDDVASNYFLNRSTTDISGVELGTIVDMLKVARQVTQPSTIVFPEVGKNPKVNLEEKDRVGSLDKKTNSARKKLFDNPLYVNKAVHGLMQLLNQESVDKNESASEIIRKMFIDRPVMYRSLFGLRRSDDTSIDKKESVAGQNLSKTTPLDDLTENYGELTFEEQPAELHMVLKDGRNKRLYYDNSVLNPHASKQSRYMLTAGEQTIATKSDDFKYLVRQIAESLKVKGQPAIKFGHLVSPGNKKMDAAVADFDRYLAADTLNGKMIAVSHLARKFPGIDYVTLITSMQAVKDVRNPSNGSVKTEFTVSADATASGGTLTFLQALGGNANIIGFLERIGLIKNKDGDVVREEGFDLYKLMTEAVSEFIGPNENKEAMPADIGSDTTAARKLVQDTLDLLFDRGNDARELSKDPTMTFVYGQGKPSAMETISRSLADRIIDNLDSLDTRKYLVELLGDPDYRTRETDKLKNEKDLYKQIVEKLKEKNGLADTLYTLLDSAVNKKYLEEHKATSKKIFNLVEKLPEGVSLRVLPAGAVLQGDIEPTIDNLKEFGMPVSKVFEVEGTTKDGDSILTRKEKHMRTVMDVSTIHGMDAALLYHAIDNVAGSDGIVVVHDDVRGTVKDVRAVEAEYRKIALEAAKKYDIHQQMMEAIAAYAPELAESSEFQTLKASIDEKVAAKNEILDKSFNEDTDALIGDGDAHVEFADTVSPTPVVQQSAETAVPDSQLDQQIAELLADNLSDTDKDTESEIEEITDEEVEAELAGITNVDISDVDTTDSVASVKDDDSAILTILKGFAKESDVINKFLQTYERSEVRKGAQPIFNVRDNTIELPTELDDGVNPKVTFDLKNPEHRKIYKEIIEHEITHSVSSAFIHKVLHSPASNNKQESLDIRYIDKAIDNLQDIFSKMSGEELQKNINEDDQFALLQPIMRAAYILSSGNKEVAINEMVAILSAEPEAAKYIYGLLAKHNKSPQLETVIKRLVNRIKEWFRNITPEDLAKENVDIELLAGAIQRTVQTGTAFRNEQKEEHAKYLKLMFNKFQGLGFTGNPSNPKVEAELSVRYMNYAFHTMINNPVERKGRTVVGKAHELMKEYFPIYSDVANKAVGIYDGSSALQELVHTITGEGVNKTKKADTLAKFAKIAEQQAETRNTQISSLNAALVGVDKKLQGQIGRFVMDTPLQDFFLLTNGLNTADDIDAEVDRLTKLMKKKNPKVIRDIDSLIELNTGDWDIENMPKGSAYNLAGAGYEMGGTTQKSADFSEEVRRLMALKSIQAVGSKDFEQFLANTELSGLVKEAVIANRIAMTSIEGLSELPDSMIHDYSQEPVEKRAVTLEQLRRYETGEDTGWKVLRPATADTLGIVYREIIDSTNIVGAYTDTRLLSNDISLPKSKKEFKGTVATANGRKLRLSKQEKAKLGIAPGFVDALAHTVSYNMAVQESQIIRDELLKQETRHVMDSADDSELVDMIKAPNIDNPWFVKLPDDVSLDKLSSAVRAKYKIASRATNVGNFNEEVTLVRKDISHWLMGGKSSAYFKNPQMRWATRIVKDFVAGSKIGMIVLNPVKIANDNLSNIAYLGVVGVDPLFIAKNYRDITKQYGEYADIKGELLRMKIRLVANPESDKLKKRAKSLEDRLSKNPLHNLDEKGFVNSLGSSLIGKNSNTLTGLQADADKALTYLLKTKDGKNNYVSHFIFQLQELGFHGEDFLQYIGGIAGNAKTTKGAEQKLDLVAERLRTIRSEKDIVNYVAQYTTSPSSEAVRLGSAVTDLTDVLAKETLYRHLVENDNVSEADARIKVLDSFPDYKENMPLVVKQMSDLGIILFPSFWMRIQKVIYRMAKEKPIGLAGEVLLQDALNSDINTIVGSNIVEKYNSFGGVFHNPADIIGLNSVVPTQIW